MTIGAVEHLLRCPHCAGELARRADGLHCPKCAHRFAIDDGIPMLFWPNEWEAGRSDVTEEVKAFY